MGIWQPRTISERELWEKTGQHEIWREIKYRKWKWIGHVLRREEGNITKIAFERQLHGVTRKRGRPEITWYSSVRTLENY